MKRHAVLALTSAKAKAKPYRLADGGALYLWVPTTGVKGRSLLGPVRARGALAKSVI